MSFDVFAECFDETKRTGLSKEAADSLFPVSREKPDSEIWVVRYDDLNWREIHCTSHIGDPQRLTGLWIHRPCGENRLWEALYSVLESGCVFLLWPNGPLVLTLGTSVEGLPKGILDDLGQPPVYVQSGLEILKLLQKSRSTDIQFILLLKRQRPPSPIILERQVQRPGRTLGRNGQFDPKFLSALHRRGIGRMFGNVEIHRRLQAHLRAG